jgi:hypothetical protein
MPYASFQLPQPLSSTPRSRRVAGVRPAHARMAANTCANTCTNTRIASTSDTFPSV